MKTYAKPILNVEEFSSEDIISTSGLTNVGQGGQGSSDGSIEWSLRATSSPVPAMDPASLFED